MLPKNLLFLGSRGDTLHNTMEARLHDRSLAPDVSHDPKRKEFKFVVKLSCLVGLDCFVGGVFVEPPCTQAAVAVDDPGDVGPLLPRYLHQQPRVKMM